MPRVVVMLLHPLHVPQWIRGPFPSGSFYLARKSNQRSSPSSIFFKCLLLVLFCIFLTWSMSVYVQHLLRLHRNRSPNLAYLSCPLSKQSMTIMLQTNQVREDFYKWCRNSFHKLPDGKRQWVVALIDLKLRNPGP